MDVVKNEEAMTGSYPKRWLNPGRRVSYRRIKTRGVTADPVVGGQALVGRVKVAILKSKIPSSSNVIYRTAGPNSARTGGGVRATRRGGTW